MRRAAANAVVATADALLAWLGTQARSRAAVAPCGEHTEGLPWHNTAPVAMAVRMRSPLMCR
jgi:hypothetical protein